MHGEDRSKHSAQRVPVRRFLGVIEHAKLTHRSFKFKAVLLRQIHSEHFGRPATKGAQQSGAVSVGNIVIQDHEAGPFSVQRFLPFRFVPDKHETVRGKTHRREIRPYVA